MSIKFFKEKLIKVLKTIERYTKTDMVYLARGGFWSLFSQVVGSISSFVVVMVLANLLSKGEFGKYRFILSIIPLITIFALPGISSSIMRSVARGIKINLPKIAITKIKWGLLGSLSALVLSSYYFYNGNNELGYALGFSALFLPFVEPFYIYSFYFKGRQDFKTPALYESISRIFQASVIIFTVFITRNIVAIFCAFLIGQICSRLFFYLKTLREEKTNLIKNDGGISDDDTIKYGKHLSITYFLSILTSNIDKLLIGHYLGAEILAVYYVALTIPKNIVLLCGTIPKVAFPKFSTNTWEPHERKKVFHKLLIFLSILFIPTLVYIFVVPFIMPIIFNAYKDSISVAVIAALIILISPVNVMIGQILQAKKAIRKVLSLQFINLLLFVVTFLILYKSFGASGAAIALITSELGILILGIFYIR